MNERIRQLALEAFQPINDITSEGVADRRTFDQAWFQHYNEKFAELIVGHAIECVRDVLRDENSDLSYVAASQVQKRLREFFGVEE